ncbi:hypothetical protein FHS18_001616 [Paenibacillus phyllosphaerae]|uniref:Uncharacterized protein n=1 Tax=Paenibacillus phyllosphaerae TaxID=274593 RepID=A0A7W5AVN9_9BACL|nr:DUF6171 family protein [Paenibacillus phyllosphaerae]MBB3109553.1 hypothetical protein [Paenibacillus phyllosphaerae]
MRAAGQSEGCKGCSASVHVSEEQIDRMIERLSRHPDSCVADSQYEDRLAQCNGCDSLQYGTTCAHCGCFVRVRAKLAANRCPRPGGGLWN